MAAFSFDFSALNVLTRDLGKLAANVMKNETVAVRLAGQEYANDVKAIAPYKTGTYRRSIHVEMSTEGLHPVALIGTDVPYGRRLEYGFYDTDSLGRKYQQYPRPPLAACVGCKPAEVPGYHVIPPERHTGGHLCRLRDGEAGGCGDVFKDRCWITP